MFSVIRELLFLRTYLSDDRNIVSVIRQRLPHPPPKLCLPFRTLQDNPRFLFYLTPRFVHSRAVINTIITSNHYINLARFYSKTSMGTQYYTYNPFCPSPHLLPYSLKFSLKCKFLHECDPIILGELDGKQNRASKETRTSIP